MNNKGNPVDALRAKRSKAHGTQNDNAKIVESEEIKKLDALAKESNVILNKTFKMVDVSQLVPSPFQGRQFDNPEVQKHIHKLAESIKDVDLMQPVVVRMVRNVLEIICGECRTRAIRDVLKQKLIYVCIIEGVSDRDAAKMLHVENEEHLSLSDYEKYLEFKMSPENSSIKTLSAANRMHRNTVSRILSMGELPEYIQASFKLYPKALTARASKDLITAVNACVNSNARNLESDVIWIHFEEFWDEYLNAYKLYYDEELSIKFAKNQNNTDGDTQTLISNSFKQPDMKYLYVNMFKLLLSKYHFEAMSLQHLLSNNEVDDMIQSSNTAQTDEQGVVEDSVAKKNEKVQFAIVNSSSKKIGTIKLGKSFNDGTQKLNIDIKFPMDKHEKLIEKFNQIINETLNN